MMVRGRRSGCGAGGNQGKKLEGPSPGKNNFQKAFQRKKIHF